MPDTRIVGGPALDAQARRVAVTVEQRGRTLLYVMNADGTDARVVSGALAVQGSPAWAPDGRVLAVGASLDGARHLFRVPLDGLPSSVIEDYAVDPVWSPAGDFIVYSTADIGTRIAVKAVTGDGRRHPAVDFTLTRGARRVRFFQDQRALVLMRGDIGHKDLWLVDLDSGRERQLTELPLDFLIRDFDLSTDGRELVVERLQEHSDIVLIDLAARK